MVQILSAALETERPTSSAHSPKRSPPMASCCGTMCQRGKLPEGLDTTVELRVRNVPQQVEVREVRCAGTPRPDRPEDLRASGSKGQSTTGRRAGPSGGSALDCFAYHGLFALFATSAASVTALDVSADALARGSENAALNQLTNIEWVAGDAFDVLPEWGKSRRRFDMVVVDSPAFAKNASPPRFAATTRSTGEPCTWWRPAAGS